SMYRSHNCGELTASHINTEVTLAGWVQKSRDKGFMNWVDLRDRYGVTQLIFDESRTDRNVFEKAKTLGREFVIQVKATETNRKPKTAALPPGNLESWLPELNNRTAATRPPLTMEEETVGEEETGRNSESLTIPGNPVKTSCFFGTKCRWKFANTYRISI